MVSADFVKSENDIYFLQDFKLKRVLNNESLKDFNNKTDLTLETSNTINQTLPNTFSSASNPLNSNARGKVKNFSNLRWTTHLRVEPPEPYEEDQMEKLVKNFR